MQINARRTFVFSFLFSLFFCRPLTFLDPGTKIDPFLRLVFQFRPGYCLMNLHLFNTCRALFHSTGLGLTRSSSGSHTPYFLLRILFKIKFALQLVSSLNHWTLNSRRDTYTNFFLQENYDSNLYWFMYLTFFCFFRKIACHKKILTKSINNKPSIFCNEKRDSGKVVAIDRVASHRVVCMEVWNSRI